MDRISSSPDQAARFTTDEFLEIIATGALDDMAVELIFGELQRMPLAGNAHGRLQVVVLAALLPLIPRELLRAKIGIDLVSDTVVAADGAILKGRVDGDGINQPVEITLVMEVAQSKRDRDRDLNLKRRLYAAAGIPTYWVVDVERAVVHVFDRPERDDYMGLALARFGEPLAVPGAGGTIVLE